MDFKQHCIDEYLANRNNDENYSVAEQTAGYWLYHASHAPLQEFDRMVVLTDTQDDNYYRTVREIIVKAIND